MWITSKPLRVQEGKPNEDIVLVNQLYLDKDKTIYLAPRGLVTDNYTIPFNINKSKLDIRPSHFHDIGCCYHQLIVVNLPLEDIQRNYLFKINNTIYCKDIPTRYLKVVDIKGREVNNLFYRMMRDSGISKFTCKVYRTGVSFNFGWFFTGKKNINLDNIYNSKLYT